MQKRDTLHIVCSNAVDAKDYHRVVRNEKKERTIRKLIADCVNAGLPMPEREADDLIAGRKFRVDLFWRDAGLVVEYEGGTATHRKASGDDGRLAQSRHVSPLGFRDDCVKYNLLAIAGFTLLRFDVFLVNDGTALTMIEHAYYQLAAANTMIDRAIARADATIRANVTPFHLPEAWR